MESIPLAQRFDRSAWTIANLYRGGVGAELLADDAPSLAGLSEETTCYVSPDYFAEEDLFANFIVHEVAHIFHNCKRSTIGSVKPGPRVWLLDMEYRNGETFPYACEAYARILERGTNSVERRALAEECGRDARMPDELVDPAEVAGIVREATAAHNGWKVILELCAPSPLSAQRRSRGARDSRR